MIIVGAGVAGSYLYALLRDEYPITVFDCTRKRGCSCAWGCFYTLLKERLDNVGLNVEDYILCKNEGLILNGVHFELRNQISIDKPKLVKDLCREVYIKKVDLTGWTSTSEPTINATGVPLCRHCIIPTYQFKVRVKGLEPLVNYIHINLKYVGYAWAFSLDDEGRWFHVGAGCVNGDPQILIDELVRRYKIQVLRKACSCNRPIRVVNPEELRTSVGGITSVGEAAGFVYPVTGEGIIPAMDSCRILEDALTTCEVKGMYFREEYDRLVKDYLHFYSYHKAFRVWRLMEKHPRTAWLKGARYLLKRTRTRAQPVITLGNLFKAIAKLLGGGG